MELMPLSSGRVRLEFESAEFESVMKALERSSGSGGTVTRRQAATYDIVSIDGIEFILMSDFEEPCLIARDAAGAKRLRALFEAQPSRPMRERAASGRTQKDLIRQIAAVRGVTQVEAREIVEHVFDAIAEMTELSGEISINGFGKFSAARKSQVEGRNPVTGEILKISGPRHFAFTPAKKLKARFSA